MKFHEMPYQRIDFEEAGRTLSRIMDDFKAAASAEEQFQVHKRYYELSDHVRTMSGLSHIRHSIDTSDPFYTEENNFYDQMLPAYNQQEVQYKNLLLQSPYRKDLEQLIGGPAFAQMELAAKSISPEVVPLMQEENALATKYENLLASAQIEWEGQVCNLSMMTPFLNHQDRTIRIRAARKVDQFYESISRELDEIYDLLVKNRTRQAHLLGFKNYTELGYCRMRRYNYGREAVESFRDQVKKDWVPFAEEIWEARRKRLGLDTLYFMDEGVSFADGTPCPSGTPEEILATGQKMYDELSPETSEFFRFMMENELLDVFSKKHKQVGGYMSYLPEYHSPFIFANFNGTSGDVHVITHECGHAFQGYYSKKLDDIREHGNITMETAETHSMSMEFFTNPWMDQFFQDRADDFLLTQLEDAVTFIPYGCMVDEFQHIVYDHPEMTPQERKAAWKQLEKEYKPHLVYGDASGFYENGGYWQRQHHIYSLPFYYIDYSIAQTNALQYRMWMENDRESAWESYLKLCRLSASDFFGNMMRDVGLKTPFESGRLKELVKGLEPIYQKLTDKASKV